MVRSFDSSPMIREWTIMPPDGGNMMGSSRTVSGGLVREFEHLRLAMEGDTRVYVALPSGQRETVFRSTAVSDSGFVVQNLTRLSAAHCLPAPGK
jgi:hypothetical protein